MNRRRPRRLLPVLAVLVPVLLLAGVYLGGHPGLLPGPARDVLVADTQAQLYDEAIDTIADDYYRPIDKDELFNRSLDGAVKSLDDRFSAYFDPKDYNSFQQTTSGKFEGVGLNVEQAERGLRVVTVFRGSPAADAGLEAGDLITAVDGRSIKGRSSKEATARIKGPAGTSVALEVVTGKDPVRTVRVKRERVDVPAVASRMERVDGRKVAYVALAGFTSGAHGEVGQAVRRLLRQGAQGVVLDLRNNGGGLLNEAVLVSSIFIPEGVIVKTKGRTRPERVYEASGNAIAAKVPVVVLVNRQSASASEIVTGALQDRKRATVVGTNTFGKGVFQEIKQLSNGGALDITVGSYFTPSGRNLGGRGVSQGKGLTPDVRAADDPETKRDEALDSALDTIVAARPT